ncbi:MAG TPA: shikimate dehydrogenase [Roseiarcus sp.]|nr:shikimate dehydrogenase [Roseiarcus sp.]
MAPSCEERILLGLIGAPIAHSASPAMHEAAAAALGFRCFYHLIEVAGADRAKLRLMVEGVRALKFAGVNVTYPYKEAVAPLLDELAPSAADVGAVNTIAVRAGRLIGFNTDRSGFAKGARRTLGDIAGQGVALFGAGGVGKAIGAALIGAGVKDIRIVDREPAKARALADVLSARNVAAKPCASADEALEGVHGLINATAVGMLPSRESPVPLSLLRGDLWVADAVYQPLRTPLLAAPRDKGAKVMTGRELAIDQAIDAFEIFTGRIASREAMTAAFDQVIKKRQEALT